MISTRLVAIAKSATIDKYTNLLSIFEVVDTITSGTFPLALPAVAVVVMTQRDTETDPENVDLDIHVRSAGKDLPSVTATIDFSGTSGNILIARVGGISVLGPGSLEFIIRHNKKQIGRFVVAVVSEVPSKPKIEKEKKRKKQGRTSTSEAKIQNK